MMTKEEMQEILRDLELDYEAEPTLIYLFYVTPDGKVNNFSISLRRGGHLSDRQLERLMRREYPATRQGTVIHTERPGWISRTEWMDVTEVCNMLHISERTLRTSTIDGGRKLYFKREEIDRVLESNAVQENGRIDNTVFD